MKYLKGNERDGPPTECWNLSYLDIIKKSDFMYGIVAFLVLVLDIFFI